MRPSSLEDPAGDNGDRAGQALNCRQALGYRLVKLGPHRVLNDIYNRYREETERMGAVTIEIPGSDRAAVQETYRRIKMMFEVVDAHKTDAEPDRRYLEIKLPGDTRGWAVEEMRQDSV